jgi:carboxylate-amine ligase
MPLPSASLPFSASDRFTLAVTEELFKVAPTNFRPRDGAHAVLATPACSTVGEAIDVLAHLRREAGRATSLLGVGVHPLGRVGDPRDTPHCGAAVHVGMPDAESVIRACNGLRRWIPLLHALGANSPYWYGRDSGLASARSVICSSFAHAGIPRAFADYADFTSSFAELRALGACPDPSCLSWDVRPRPDLGTLEIRALDAQSSLDDLVALVALMHCLAVHEARADARREPSPELLRELDFRASRDGLDARLMLDGDIRSVREIAYRAIAVAGAYAPDLGCWDELMTLHRLLEEGNGAQRQRRNEQEGGLRLMLRRLADETLPPERVAVSAPEHTAEVLDLPVAAAAPDIPAWSRHGLREPVVEALGHPTRTEETADPGVDAAAPPLVALGKPERDIERVEQVLRGCALARDAPVQADRDEWRRLEFLEDDLERGRL